MSNCKNPIIQKSYYCFCVELASPLCIASSESSFTDADVLRNGNGECFVPGTSLAGAFRNTLDSAWKDSRSSLSGIEYAMGGMFSDADYLNDRMSKVWISDLNFCSDYTVSERDGVQLTDDHTVENKFDMQIIETGARGLFYMEYIQREKDDVFADGTKINQRIREDSFIQEIIYRMNIGEIRLGSNKNRGFGRVKVLRVYCNQFTKENKQEYLDFLSKDRRPNLDIRTSAFKDKIKGIKTIYRESRDLNNVTTENGLLFTTINIPLKLNGGISIRKYSTKEGEPDYTHITCDNKPIIPGSSWNGAIRHRMKQILVELFLQINPNVKQKAPEFANKSIKKWFGYINEGKGGDDTSSGEDSVPASNQSLIVFGESVIEGSQALTITRNKIDRFTAGTVSGALYTEKSYFGGSTTLSIMVRKDEKRNYEACIDALWLVLCDLSDGLLAVGGQVAVGRGVFSKNTDAKIVSDIKTEVIESECFKHLYRYIKGGCCEMKEGYTLKKIAEAPKKGHFLAYLRNEVQFEEYDNRDMIIEKMENLAFEKNVLELHLFDEKKEYRAILSREEKGYIEHIADFADEEDTTYKEEWISDAGENKNITIINRITFDAQGIAQISDYRMMVKGGGDGI